MEVVNLAEYPTAMVGAFDEEFLAVPEEIIVDAMLMHQRYFPLYDAQGKLSNKFIVVSNGDPAFTETIVDGNERVYVPASMMRSLLRRRPQEAARSVCSNAW